MKINFIIPEINLTGGIRVVSIYAQLLSEFGHDVTVISPAAKTPSFKRRVYSFIKSGSFKTQQYDHKAFFNKRAFELVQLKTRRPVLDDDVPDADVVIATFWNTAEWVNSLDSRKGKKVYFLQHYEVHPWLPVDRVKATLRLPLKKITVADWISEVMNNEYGDDSVTTVPNAVDMELFNAPSRQKNSLFKFGMMYSNKAFKGSEMALTCFERLRKKYPTSQLVAFGTEPEQEVKELYPFLEYYYAPSQARIAEIYASCDCWLFTSTNEGFGLPLLEAMACRTPVIGTKTGAAPELLKDGAGLLIDVSDNNALMNAMQYMCELSPERWQLMSARAYEVASSHSWYESARMFEDVLKSTQDGHCQK